MTPSRTRPRPACKHHHEAWAPRNGIASCRTCGVRRFVDYRALAFAVALPERPLHPTRFK
ncbi:DUF6255 family natural product biosynthesis protein [Streptomyces stramineus]|uniref:DUF6255 family natural product biosynthesis protein n=1 Tax=Streptomyces TaxID=1883 RepID=UPI0033C2DE78